MRFRGKQKFTHVFHFKLHSNTHHLYTTHRQKNLSEDLPLGSIRIRLDKASRSQQKRNHPKQIHNLEDTYCTQILSQPIASSSVNHENPFCASCVHFYHTDKHRVPFYRGHPRFKKVRGVFTPIHLQYILSFRSIAKVIFKKKKKNSQSKNYLAIYLLQNI